MALVGYDPRQGATRAATKVREGWGRFAAGFTTGQKAVTILAVLGLVLGVVVFARFASTPSYQPLFTGLQASDAASITAKLKSAGVPYKLANGGATIEVPSGKVDQERLSMAAAGLPQAGAGAGLSLLDKEGITTSQFTQQADYQRAIQDELSNTIDSIQGVKGSKVAVVLPSQSAFALGNAQKPSASVMVDLAAGASLAGGQVSAISHLVASAVPDLTPSAVTVVDSNGTLLTGPGAQVGPAATLNAAQSYDTALDASLTSMLESIVGPGNAQVRVAATLSSASTKTVTHGVQVSPKGSPVKAPSQTSQSNETFSGTGSVPGGGVLGVGTTTKGSGNSKYSKTQTSTSYENGVVDTTQTQPPGQVSRLDVSVVVNKLPKGVTLSSLSKSISAAAGIVPSRGDTLSVVSIPFSNVAAKQAATSAKAAAKAASKAKLLKTAKDGGVIVAILAALLVLWRKARKRGAPAPPGPVAALEPPEPTPLGSPPAHTEVLPAVATETSEALASHPDVASRVLQAWLTEAHKVGAQ